MFAINNAAIMSIFLLSTEENNALIPMCGIRNTGNALNLIFCQIYSQNSLYLIYNALDIKHSTSCPSFNFT